MTDYTREELEVVFDKVHDPKDWRAPISVNVRTEDLFITLRAIEYFTGTNPLPGYIGSEVYNVTSEGYRNGPCGP